VKPFEFATAGRIIFGVGKLAELSGVVRSLGNRVLVVCGGRVDRAQPAIDLLRQAGCDVSTFSIPGEPEVGWIEEGAAIARKAGCEVVVGFGGGSALDAAKAIAALATNARPVFDYLEVIGKGQALDIPALPIATVPTTAGTGAEVTRNAVLSSKEHRVKASLRSAHMLPRVAIVDPELTYNLPPELTASTGMDALTQVIEPFVSSRANPMVDALCREAIPRIARALPRVFKTANDIEARRDMSLASLFGGLALANAGLGAVHGFAAPIGGMFPVPHGAVCAALLPEVMRMNMEVAQVDGHSETVSRYDQVAQMLTGLPAARGIDGVEFVKDLCRSLSIPRLREFSIIMADLPEIAQKAAQASSMKANPVLLSQAELVDILEATW
jgi:alcohol dehydrogenase class IV